MIGVKLRNLHIIPIKQEYNKKDKVESGRYINNIIYYQRWVFTGNRCICVGDLGNREIHKGR